jgi:hypothetical protein
MPDLSSVRHNKDYLGKDSVKNIQTKLESFGKRQWELKHQLVSTLAPF